MVGDRATSALGVTSDGDGDSGELDEALVGEPFGLALSGGVLGTGSEGKRGEVALAEVEGGWRLRRLLLGGIRSTPSPPLAVVASIVASEVEPSSSRSRFVDLERMVATGEKAWLAVAPKGNAVVGVRQVLSAAGVGMTGVRPTGSVMREGSGTLDAGTPSGEVPQIALLSDDQSLLDVGGSGVRLIQLALDGVDRSRGVAVLDLLGCGGGGSDFGFSGILHPRPLTYGSTDP